MSKCPQCGHDTLTLDESETMLRCMLCGFEKKPKNCCQESGCKYLRKHPAGHKCSIYKNRLFVCKRLKKAKYNLRCSICGKLIQDPNTIPHKEKFKSRFTPRIHGHGASNHGNEPEMNEIATRERNGQKGDL